MNNLKVFNCENYLPCRGYPEISKCIVLAETQEVALGLALEKYPDMPANNWEIYEVPLTGGAQILFEEHLSY